MISRVAMLLILVLSFWTTTAKADQCSDILANGIFEIEATATEESNAVALVNYIRSDTQIVKALSSESGGGGEIVVPQYLWLSGDGGQKKLSSEELRELLTRFQQNDVAAFKSLNAIAQRASSVIAAAWGDCMRGYGLKAWFKATSRFVTLAFSYDTGGPNNVMTIGKITVRGGVSNCAPSENIVVQRGIVPVICDRSDEEGLIAIDTGAYEIANLRDNIIITPARVALAAVISKPDRPVSGDVLRDQDSVVLRFTNSGDWYLENAGPGQALTTMALKEEDLQKRIDLHTFTLVKEPGVGSKGPFIESGDVVRFVGQSSGHRAMALQDGALIAAKDQGIQHGATFKIIVTDVVNETPIPRPQGGRVESGNYIVLQDLNSQQWVSHAVGASVPSMAGGPLGPLQSMFIRRPKG